MAFVVSGGSLRAIEGQGDLRSGWPSYGTALNRSTTLTYGALYRTQPAVRTVISFLARNLAQLGLHTFERMGDNDRRRIADHPLARILARPNPSTTTYRLINALVSDKAVYDDAYWVKLRAEGGEPVGLRRLQPWRVEPIGPEWSDPDQYRIHGSRGYLDVDRTEIVHFRGYNPDDAHNGCSPIESLRQVLADEYAAAHWREQMWSNGARISGYLQRPADAAPWGDTARSRFKSEWQAQYTGDGPQAGGTPILEDGMTFVQAGINPRDAQYVESRKLTREEVAAAYHIAPPLVGILDHATFSNIREQHKGLYQDTLGPWCAEIEQEIGLQLAPDLAAGRTVYVEFNIGEKLQGSFEEQAAQLQAAVGGPWMTRDEARARSNLPHIDGADELIVPLNVITGGLASPRDTAPPPKSALLPALRGSKARPVRVKGRAPTVYDNEGAETLRVFFGRQSAAVRSRLGAAKARGAKASIGDVWDADRWNRELAAELLTLALDAARAVAEKILRALGLTVDYDEPRTVPFQRAVAERVAASVNEVTRRQLVDALDADDPAAEVTHVFDVAQSHRAPEVATAAVTAASGFASEEAVKQTGRRATKTWLVTSDNPRPTHAVMHEQTVELEAKFSNGAKWPADAALSVDEVAGCQCELEIAVEDDDED
ncbi:phage portal protein [Micromonospora sp. DT227]|uniref:phage portal protein n=1 Tax=Micromonospora sp. DT227 TaxID=3393433 RepID=UPI003CFB288A